MMKQIPILFGKAMIVELPEGATNPRVFPDTKQPICLFDHPDGWDGISGIDLPPGRWQMVGMLSEVTEKEVALVVPIHRQSIIGDVYKDFKTGKWDAFDALESLESAIVAERYYLDKNPVPPFDERLNDWIEAQSRMLSRERCLLLRRVDI